MPITGPGVLKPLYDSGWVLSAAGVNTFTHNLGAIPTLVTVMAADDSGGTSPVVVMRGWSQIGGVLYGIREDAPETTTQFTVFLATNYAYNGTKWYTAGTDYVRLLIWAME